MKAIACLLLFILTGCTHSQIMQDCHSVQDVELFVCKTVQPWK